MGKSDLYGPADDTESIATSAVKNFLAYTLRRLGTNWADIYLRLVEELRRVAVSKGATVAQVAIAWVPSRGEDVVPLVGVRRRERLTEAVGAMKLDGAASG